MKKLNELVAISICEDTGSQDLEYVLRRVNEKLPHITTDERMLGIIGVHNKDTWAVDILNRETKEVIVSIDEYAGELNHWNSGTDIVLSLMYDSGYSLEELLGEKPIVKEDF